MTVRHGGFLKVAFLGAALCASSLTPAQAQTTEQQLSMGELFEGIAQMVKGKYVNKNLTNQKLLNDALKGMLTGLDPHSDYMSPEEFMDMKIQMAGEFGGLGIKTTMEDGLVKVISPIDGTPAARAGLKPGDLIVKIGSRSVHGMSPKDAVDAMRGKPGKPVTLVVLRRGEAPRAITLTRAIIKVKAVTSRSLGDGIGYIRLSTFKENAGGEVREALNKLKAENGGRLKGVVLDLRNDPGGLLDEAVRVAGLFLPGKSLVVSTMGRNASDNNEYRSSSGDRTGGAPLMVLINNGSASASEIVAGALQDHHRATIVGSQSFGKGSVQSIIPLSLPEDSTLKLGALRLTTAKYYTPSGRSIQDLGVTPETEVKNHGQIPLIDSETALKGAIANPNAPGAFARRQPNVTCSFKPGLDTKSLPPTFLDPQDGKPDEALVCADDRLRGGTAMRTEIKPYKAPVALAP